MLIVEILGAKILAPYVGTSHFVWTAQISVTLLSLAAGYYWGGRWVKSVADLRRLFYAMIWAALYLVISVLVAEKVAYICLDFGLKLGSVLASAFLFFVPLTLLAMTGPFLIHILTQSLDGVGDQAGKLSSVSTLGSVLGAGSIGYVLIPFLPNSITMFLTAGTLLLLALIYFLRFHAKLKGIGGPMILAVCAIGLGAYGVQAGHRTNFGRATEIYRHNSNFGMLQVIQVKGSDELFYVNDYLAQNIYYTNTHQSGALFTYMLHGLAHAYTPKLESALCIGLGVGIVPSQFAQEGVSVDVVEINEAVIPLAEKYFDLHPEQVHIHIGDGRHFLNRATNRYDTVVLDAFLGDSSPSHLMTREAFGSMRRVLRPGGTLVINCFGFFEPGKDYFVASLEKTLQSVFKSVRIHDSNRGNVFMVASDTDPLVLTPPENLDYVHPSNLAETRRTFVTVVTSDPSHGRVLTDDYNPVDFYDAKNRETFRRNMALGMKVE